MPLDNYTPSNNYDLDNNEQVEEEPEELEENQTGNQKRMELCHWVLNNM